MHFTLKSWAVMLTCVIFVHFLFRVNKTYDVYTEDVMTSQQYEAFIKTSSNATYPIDIYYFGSLPGWTINLVYTLYLVLAIIMVRWITHDKYSYKSKRTGLTQKQKLAHFLDIKQRYVKENK